jgi:hypothetical protein
MYSSEEFMIVCISESSFLCARYGCPKCREEDDVLGVLLENIFDAFLEEACHFGAEMRKTNAGRPIAISRKKRREEKNGDTSFGKRRGKKKEHERCRERSPRC